MNTWQISPAPNPQENNHMNSNVHWQEKNKILKGKKKHRKNTPKYTVSNQIPKRTCPHWKIQLKGKKKKEKKRKNPHTTKHCFCDSVHPNMWRTLACLSFFFLSPFQLEQTICQQQQSEHLLMSQIYTYISFTFYFIAILNVPSWVLSPCVKGKCTFLCFVYWWIIKIDLTDH